jgi:hypothetical protein
MSPKLPNIVFGPWISHGGVLLRHVHWSPRAIAPSTEEYNLLLPLATRDRSNCS